jgi:hypothetical protein
MLDDGEIGQSVEDIDLGCHRVRHASEAHPVELGEAAGEVEVLAVSRDCDVMVRIRPAKPLMGLVGIVAPEFLVMNGLDQLRGLSTMPCLHFTTGYPSLR